MFDSGNKSVNQQDVMNMIILSLLQLVRKHIFTIGSQRERLNLFCLNEALTKRFAGIVLKKFQRPIKNSPNQSFLDCLIGKIQCNFIGKQNFENLLKTFDVVRLAALTHTSLYSRCNGTDLISTVDNLLAGCHRSRQQKSIFATWHRFGIECCFHFLQKVQVESVKGLEPSPCVSRRTITDTPFTLLVK
jgi:hypothetical protein